MSIVSGASGKFLVSRGIVLAGLFVLAVAWWSSSKSAQDSACVVKGSQISSEAVNKFFQAPEALLAKYTAGGGGLSADVRDLVVTDPKTLDAMIVLISKSNAAQKSAIGTGLGLASAQCQRTQPDFAAAIQRVAAVLKDATGSIDSASSKDPATVGGVRTAATGNPPSAPATPGGTATACVPASSQASAEAINKFIEAPEALLNKYRSGGGGLSAEVRDLVVTDSKTLEPIIALISNANATQKSAIGAGLGLAAAFCQKTQPDLAAAIQRAVAELKDPTVTLAFLSSSKDPITAALGFGGFPAGPRAAGPVGTGALVIGNTPAFNGVTTASSGSLSLGSGSGSGPFGGSASPKSPSTSSSVSGFISLRKRQTH